MQGWIKLHRKITEWEWYNDSSTFRLFVHLLLKANHRDKSYRGKIVKKGCLLTGRDLLAVETGLSVRQIRTSLDRLKFTEEIAIKTSSQGTEIQVLKYSDYQIESNEQASEHANKRPTRDQRETTNKNDKNDKNEKEYNKDSVFNFKNELLSIGVSLDLVDDFLEVRKKKKSVNTKVAFNSIKKEIDKSDLNSDECIKIAVERSWSTFKNEWVNNAGKKQSEVRFSPI